MGKGNSGILSKHQVKLAYTGTGIIGDVNGYEVLTEVVIRFRSLNAKAENVVRICGRTANDTKWYELGFIKGDATEIFQVASWDYVMYDTITYDSSSTSNSVIASGFFNDGMFVTRAIEAMSVDISDKLDKIDDSICGIQEEINIINRQIEIITDNEEDELK